MTLSLHELQSLRQNYKRGTLDEHACPSAPSDLFQSWLKDAVTSECDEPNAFTLSTSLDGRPHARVVLLKGIVDEGITFFSNYDSPKGVQLKENPFAAATFLWLPLERQVRIEGIIGKVPSAVSDDYFAKRPRGSQIGALASPQGQVVPSRRFLEEKFREIDTLYPEGTPIPRPTNWGGFQLMPTVWEFWQGRENRLHDRVRYRKEQGAWIRERLAP